ncbi:Fungal lipase-like domain-containing protein [Plasmodiophora brassicae]|uniref:Fungal lipase-type domain-containing protein n=1 Tax=Plasmodiophora brassicae TaxID=37360 RepID=A0A0G4IIG3_PLABS|nr:hypothetical protein PBRA_003685 [Plasmodiophora brassicae]SPQ94204.1 unnamed protein product [Plasmodiophora brassicae]
MKGTIRSPSKALLADLIELCGYSPRSGADLDMRVSPMNWYPVSVLQVGSGDGGTEVAIFEYAADLVVVFRRGDDDAGDLSAVTFEREKFTDLVGMNVSVNKVALGMWRDLNVHEFVAGWANENPAGRVFITGYAMGGTMALLQAMYTQNHMDLGDRLVSITFGAVRAGSRTFVRNFNGAVRNAYRFVNAMDPVSELGGCSLARLHHPGAVRHLLDDGIHLTYISKWRALLAATFDGSDHALDAYADAVASWNGKIID